MSMNVAHADMQIASEETSSLPVKKSAHNEVSVETSSSHSPAIVWEDDSANPHNWPQIRKYVNTILLSAFTFNTLMSSTIVAPALSQIRRDLKIATDTQTQLVLSIFVISYAVGYFLWAPLSEVYGRRQVLQVANIWFLVWNLVCGFAKNEATITTGRLLSGAGAAAPIALGSGSLAEIWRPAQRGRSLAVLSLITNLGPAIGPVIGGAIAQQSPTSWRWAFWSTSILNGCLQLISLRFLYESHRATIVSKKYPDLVQNHTSQPQETFRTLVIAFKRPLHLLTTAPALQGLAIYTCYTFGTLYIIISVIPIAFTTIHRQSTMIASLHYLAFACGTTFGAQVCAPIIDFLYHQRTKRQMQQDKEVGDSVRGKIFFTIPPEVRLYPVIPTILMMSAGLLLFGWTLHAHYHWISTDIGIFLFGAGNQAMTQCTNAYTIDIFGEVKITRKRHYSDPAERQGSACTDKDGELTHAKTRQHHTAVCDNVNWSASGMASIWAAKSLGGFTFPLFAIDMINHIGWGWSGTLLALLNVAIGVPLTVGLVCWGEKLRGIGIRRMGQRMDMGKM